MTNVLVTSAPAIGHVNLVLPVARSLRRLGHSVTVAASPEIHWHVGKWQLPHVRKAPLRYPVVTERSAWKHIPVDMAITSAQEILRLAEDVNPTHIVFDRSDLGAALAASHLQLKAVCVASTGFGTFNWMRAESQAIIEEANETLRLSRADMALSRPTWLTYLPHSFHGSSVSDIASDVIACDPRESSLVRSAGSGRRILLSYGTTPRVPREVLLKGLIERLSPAFEIGVVAPPGATGLDSVPSNVEILDVPSLEGVAFEYSVVGCHGGMSTVTEALSSGVPVHSVPFSRDQQYIASLCSNLGAGDMMRFDEESVMHSLDEISEAIARVASEEAYAIGALSFAREYAELPRLDEILSRW
ncbi:glycosyltransferase [Nonomuraea sp. NPDC049400]|uniref:glycosyltransferase n=1 Tax=Nonomuraea sp. NPDC049400 TaxID=3364352 RepID=UPI0037B3DB78